MVAKWLTADHCCDVCGEGPFLRPSRLLSHRFGKACRKHALTGVEHRADNLARAVKRHVAPFRHFLEATAKRQRKARRSPVLFIPFGQSRLLTKDIFVLTRKSLQTCPRTKPLRVQIATCAAIAQLWTDRWAQVLRAVPAPRY